MANKRTHIDAQERFCIEKMLDKRASFRFIADTLNRGVSTISEEINRHGGWNHYTAEKAHIRAYFRQYRKKRGCNKVALSRFLTKYVEAELTRKVSPEAIAGRLKLMGYEYASGKSIRRYINKRPGLERYLFWNRVRTQSGSKRKRTAQLQDRIWITERPVVDGPGHFEGDFIVSKKSTWVVLVLVDQVTCMTLVKRLPNRNNDAVNNAIVSLLSAYQVKTLTLDNDIAFQKHAQLARALKAPVYFTRVYRSTDKALVENTNRWLRVDIPKTTDIQSVSDSFLASWQAWWNTIPRACLGFKSAHEVHYEML